LSGEKTKKLAEFSDSDKGGKEAVAKLENNGHGQKSIEAIGGKSDYDNS